MKFFKWLFLLLLLFILTASVIGYFSYCYIKDYGETPHELTTPRMVELKRGMSLRDFSEELALNGLTDSATKFLIWTRIFSSYNKFQAGPYRFKKDVSPKQIAKKVLRGKVYRPIVFKFTVPEGATYKQLTTKLVSLGIGTTEEYQKLFSDKEFINELKIPSETLEGFIYPATYSFLVTPKPKDFIKKAVNTFWNKLPTEYTQQLQALKINLKEAVTIASLIELETPQQLEKPLISEVIWRRLKANMSLGIDAAIIYGIKDYNGNITAKHLADSTNAYNTRIHKGIPPTPISSPDIASLLAVLHPANAGNYYFVVDPENPKHHVFAKDFKTHQQNVRRYVQAYRKR